MLNVTDKAAGALLESLEAARNEDSQLLRLTQSAEGLALALDEERDGDQVVDFQKSKVLVIEEQISKQLDGATLDAVDTPEGTKLVLQSS